MKVVKALKRKDDAISHAAVDTLCALMQVGGLWCLSSWYQLGCLYDDSQCMTTLT